MGVGMRACVCGYVCVCVCLEAQPCAMTCWRMHRYEACMLASHGVVRVRVAARVSKPQRSPQADDEFWMNGCTIRYHR